MENKIRQGIGELIKSGKKEFVIYPYGKYGKITKKILNDEYGISERYLVDQNNHGDDNIKSVDFLREDYSKHDFVILVSVDPLGWDTYLQVHKTILSFAKMDRIADLLVPWSHYDSKIRQGIGELIKSGKKEFVIYPYGKYGKITKEILNDEYGISERYLVDQNNHGDDNIKSVDFLREDYSKHDFVILLSVDPLGWDTYLQVHKTILSFAKMDRIADLLSWSPFLVPWSHYDRIYCPKSKDKIALLESLAREIYMNKISGNVAEAGVYRGETAKFINMLFPDRKLYLFDTFEGFSSADLEKEKEYGHFALDCDFSETGEQLVLDKMCYSEQCIIKKGWFPESASDLQEEKFALVRLDMDLYTPIYAGLEFFLPRMERGGYIVIHDCRSRNFDGARAALVDFCKKNHLGYMCMTDSLGSAVISIEM